MVTNEFVLSGREPYVFRDGRPFGDAAMTRGGALRWPLPGTLAGMIRSRYGEMANVDFRNGAVIDRLKRIAVSQVWPICRTGVGWSLLHSAPADAVVFDELDPTGNVTNRLEIKPLIFSGTATNSGTDLSGMVGADWLFGNANDSRKLSMRTPVFWHWTHVHDWLLETSISRPEPSDLGIPGATQCLRIHTAINPDTGTASESQLFMSQGVRLGHRQPGAPSSDTIELGFALRIEDCPNPALLAGHVYLGAERKVAWLDQIGQGVLPDLPGNGVPYAHRQFLRIILTTPGYFLGGWRPIWLDPLTWNSIPGTAFGVRLRGACLAPWLPVSGYDYQKHGPKPTRKLVPAGSVYLVEVKPAESQEVARHLWGRSIADDEQAARDGYGIAIVGLANQCLQSRFS